MVDQLINLVDEFGLFVFPLSVNSKIPMKDFKWRNESSDDLFKIYAWAEEFPGCNWGVDTGKSGLCVLDVDNKNGKSGSFVLEMLEVENSELPNTFTVETPTGGYHLYYKGYTPNTAGKLGVGLDTRSDGGYVVAPFSHIDGKEYSLEQRDIPEMPYWVTDKIGEKTERETKESVFTDDYNAILDAIRYVNEDSPEAVEGSGGNGTTYSVACRVRDFGLSVDVATRIMLDHYNPKCQPSWENDEMIGIVRNAYSYAKLAAGSSDAVLAFEGFDPEPTKSEINDEFVSVQASSLVGLPEEDEEFLFTDLIPKNEVSLLSGDGGTGKSLLATQLAFAVAGGTDFMNLESKNQMPVFQVSCEDKISVFQKRKYYIEQNEGFSLHNAAENLYYIPRKGKSTILGETNGYKVVKTKFYKELDEYLTGFPGEKLLILDTVADIFAGNENERTTVNQFVKYILGSLIEKHNATIILIAHPPKSGADYSGSTAWNNAVRARYSFKRPDDNGKPDLRSDLRILETSKSNYSGVGQQVYMQFHNGTFALDTSNGQDFIDDMTKGVSDLLLEHIKLGASNGTPYSPHHNASNPIFGVDIQTKAGGFATKKEMQRALNTLISGGKVEKIDRGKKGKGLFPINGADHSPLGVLLS